MSEDALLSLGSMEGVEIPAPKAKTSKQILPGYVAAALVGAIAYGIHYLPFPPFLVEGRRPVSASIIAILVALAARNLLTVPAKLMPGCKDIVKRVIPAAIVLTGAGLDLTRVTSIGAGAFGVVVASMAAAAAAAVWIGRALGLSRAASLLIGSGTAVCGTSAIVATAPLIEAEDDDLTLSIGTVSLLGLLLMFLLPVTGGLLNMSQQQFGVWAGTSIHAVPQVVAAGSTYGADAGSLATLVRLARVALLAPFLLILVSLAGRRDGSSINARKLIPSFIWGFFLLAVLHTLRLTPSLLWENGSGVFKLPFSEVANWLLTLAMAAIGLEVNVRLLIQSGGRAIAAGGVATLVLCALSWWLIRFFL